MLNLHILLQAFLCVNFFVRVLHAHNLTLHNSRVYLCFVARLVAYVFDLILLILVSANMEQNDGR